MASNDDRGRKRERSVVLGSEEASRLKRGKGEAKIFQDPPPPAISEATSSTQIQASTEEKLHGSFSNVPVAREKKNPHEEELEKIKTDRKLKREKHNQVERRRRGKISTLFSSLADALNCKGADKAKILETALECAHNHNIQEHYKRFGADQMATAILDSKSMILMIDAAFMGIFQIQPIDGRVQLAAIISPNSHREIQNNIYSCQSGSSSKFEQMAICSTSSGHIVHARISATMLLIPWFFVTKWHVVKVVRKPGLKSL